MTDVAGSRQIIQQESVDFRSAISEAVAFEIAQLNNFHAFFQHNRHYFKINGNVSLASGETGIDGVFTAFKNCELVGVSATLQQTGSGVATQQFDIHRIDSAGVDQGSIFASAPGILINSTDPDGGTVAFETFLGVRNDISTNGTAIIRDFGTSTLSAGESLRFDADSVGATVRDLTVCVIYRPID